MGSHQVGRRRERRRSSLPRLAWKQRGGHITSGCGSDYDNHCLSGSRYAHGILLGDGWEGAKPVCRVLLPKKPAGGNQITQIKVTVEGTDDWWSTPRAHICSEGPSDLPESGTLQYAFTDSAARALLADTADGLASQQSGLKTTSHLPDPAQPWSTG